MSTLINIYWSNEFSLCDNKLNQFKNSSTDSDQIKQTIGLNDSLTLRFVHKKS